MKMIFIVVSEDEFIVVRDIHFPLKRIVLRITVSVFFPQVHLTCQCVCRGQKDIINNLCHTFPCHITY